MGSAQSNLLGPEAMAAGAIVAGAAVTAVALDNGWFGGKTKKTSGTEASDLTTAAPAIKKGGSKLSKEEKEFDKILAQAVSERRLVEAAVASASASRVVGLPDVVPGSFEDTFAVEEPETKKKKKRKAVAKKVESAASTVVVTSPENSIVQVPPAAVSVVIANESGAAPTAKKSKKRKAANPAGAQAHGSNQPSSSSAAAPMPSGNTKPKSKAAGAANDDNAWTRVEPKKRPPTKRNPSSTTPLANSVTDADSLVSPTSASASVSLTGDEHTTETSAPDTGAEATDKASADEEEEEEAGLAGSQTQSIAGLRTGVEDMLPPSPPPARVLKIVPGPNDRPAPGFNWGDYEDADISTHDADEDEDDEGWGVVRSRRSFRTTTTSSGFSEEGGKSSSSAPSKASETMTKRKRQNKTRSEQEKADKIAAEKERERLLREHKRGLEKLRMEEQSRTSKSKELSGGSKSSLDSSGHLVWE